MLNCAGEYHRQLFPIGLVEESFEEATRPGQGRLYDHSRAGLNSPHRARYLNQQGVWTSKWRDFAPVILDNSGFLIWSLEPKFDFNSAPTPRRKYAAIAGRANAGWRKLHGSQTPEFGKSVGERIALWWDAIVAVPIGLKLRDGA